MNEKIPVTQYAEQYGFPEQAVLHRIRAGVLAGIEEEGQWYVLRPVRPKPQASLAESSDNDERGNSTVVTYTNDTFIHALLYAIALLIPLNLRTLLGGEWLALLPIAFLSTLAVAIWKRWPRVRTLVRVWAALLIISGLAGVLDWIARFAMHAVGDPDAFSDINVILTISQPIFLLGGLAIFVLSGKYIKTDRPSEGERAS